MIVNFGFEDDLDLHTRCYHDQFELHDMLLYRDTFWCAIIDGSAIHVADPIHEGLAHKFISIKTSITILDTVIPGVAITVMLVPFGDPF